MSEKSFVTATSASELQPVEEECSIERICPDRFQFNWSAEPNLWTKEPLAQLILEAYKQTESGDVQVEIGESTFKCHMLVLQSYSKLFQARSRNETRTIVLNASDIEPAVFALIYHWMRSEEKRVPRTELVRLLMGAEHLQVDILVQQCWNRIQNLRWFNEDQAFLLYREARECGYEKIQRMAVQHMSRIFLTVVASSDFVELSLSEVVHLLQLDSIAVNSEIDVFYAAARWLLHDWSARKRHLMEVMQCIRFGLVDSTRIVMLRRNGDANGRLRELLTSKDLQDALKHALNYAIYREHFESSDFGFFADFLVRFEYRQLFERRLVVDPYWQRRSFDQRSLYSFEDFLGYLHAIKANALTHWTTLEAQ